MRYLGSKARIAKEILPIILKDRKPGQWYVEPFVGGANTMVYADGPRIGNDANEYVIVCWKAFVDGWRPESMTEAERADIKANPGSYPPYVVGFAGQMSFGGKWFDTYPRGRGKDRNHFKEVLNLTAKKASKLKSVNLCSGGYENTPIPLTPAIIYCDPPYRGTTGYRDSIDHEKFYVWCHELSRAGHSVFISEYAMPEDRFACIWEKPHAVNFASQRDGKKRIERLFVPKGFTK